jgi:CspA family cold shock protein
MKIAPNHDAKLTLAMRMVSRATKLAVAGGRLASCWAVFFIAQKPDAADTDVSFKGRCEVATGTVKWFNATKGFGFIQPDGGGKDVFVHISAVEKAGLNDLREGAKINYDIISDRGKEAAGNLQVK